MILLISFLITILGFIALLNVEVSFSKRALSVCAKVVVAFLKTAQVLFWEYAYAVIAITCILLAFGNHFVIDYDIVVLLSSLILIKYHTFKLFGLSSVLFSI